MVQRCQGDESVEYETPHVRVQAVVHSPVSRTQTQCASEPIRGYPSAFALSKPPHRIQHHT
eukprot:365399-Chlamydomonas_euryale.AAC.2